MLEKPKLLLMGLRRSGKSSIQQVVFNKMPPNETLFLESTYRVQKVEVSQMSSIVDFQVWDFPGHIDFFDPSFETSSIFSGVGALIFVIDSQDDYIDALSKLFVTVTRAYKANPLISYEIFIHKVDGLSEDHKIETQRDIQQRMNDELLDAGLEQIHLNFHLTSIYDHSIFEAFSKVIQKLMPRLPTLENLLNIFCSNSGIEKAFLFDLYSKIYIATDSSPVDMQTYELCSDMIDVVMDISLIYNYPVRTIHHAPTLATATITDSGDSSQTSTAVENVVPPFNVPAMTTNDSNQLFDSSSPHLDFENQTKASAVIQLNNGTMIMLQHITSSFALVCVLRAENFQNKRGWLEVNFQKFKSSIEKVLT